MKPQSCQSPARGFPLCDHAARDPRTLSAFRPVATAVQIAALACAALMARDARAQYAGAQYVQPAPNYVTYPQAKPSPYGYPAQPDPQAYGQPQYAQPQDAQQYPQQPQQYPQPQYADPGSAAQQYAPQPDQYAPPQQPAQPFAAQQLEQLVAPIALYPDQLVAQILAAATYPAQVIAADNWLHAQGYASPEQIAYAADSQANWDPSVKALTAFPQVLDLMNHDLGWTTDLGNAYYNQPQDVLQIIQVMRQRAEDAGSLQSTPQEAVSYNQGYIQLAPTNPEVVYVPAYNPWAVYGQPVAPYPGFSLFGTLASLVSGIGGGFGGGHGGGGFGGGFGAGGLGGGIGSGALRFGLGVALSAFSHTPFGWAGWALNWLTSSIFFHQSPYVSQSTTVAHWGGGRGGSYYGSQIAGRGGYGGERQPGYNRFGNGAGGPTFTRPPLRTPENPAYNGGNGGFDAQNRGYATARPANPGYAYARPQQPARPESYARSESYARPGGNGNSFYSNSQQAYAARPAAPYPGQAARAPTPAFQHNDYAQRSYSAAPRTYAADPRSYSGAYSGSGKGSYGGSRNIAQAYSREDYSKQERGGGSHMFGGGHGEQNYHASYKAPKMPKAPKAPKMSAGGGHHSGGIFNHHGGR